MPWAYQYRVQRQCTRVQRYPPCNRNRNILAAAQEICTIWLPHSPYSQLDAQKIKTLWTGRNLQSSPVLSVRFKKVSKECFQASSPCERRHCYVCTADPIGSDIKLIESCPLRGRSYLGCYWYYFAFASADSASKDRIYYPACSRI